MPPDIDPTAAERYAIEIRAAVLRTVTAANEGRRGVSDRLEIGSGASYIVDDDEEDPYADSEDSSDSVSGMEEVRVGGDLWENVRRNRTLAARKLEMTVHGKLTLECMSDTAMFGGALTETHVGGEFLAAGMSDDLVIGAGVRATAAGDLWTTGLMGMEEKIGTAAADGTLVETYAIAMEREFGPGTHISQVALFKGALHLTTAAGFRQMMKVQLGVRNHTPGGGGGGGGSGQPPPAAGAAAGGGAIAGGLLLAGGGAADSFTDTANLVDLAQAARVAEDLAGLEDVRHLDSLSVVEDLRSIGRAAENGEDVTELPQMRRLQDLTEFPSPAGVAQTDELARGEDTGTLVVHAEIETDWLNNVGVADGDGRNVADGGGRNVLDGKADGGGYLDDLEDLRKALEDEPPDTARRLELESAIKSSDEAGAENLAAVTISLQRPYEGDVSAEYARGRLLELRDEYTNAGDLDNAAYIQMRIDAMDKDIIKYTGAIVDETKRVEGLKTLARTEGGGYLADLEDLRKALEDAPPDTARRLELESAIKSSDEAGTENLAVVTISLQRPYEGDVSAEYARGRLLELRDEYTNAGDLDNAAYIQMRIDAMDKDIIKSTGAIVDESRRVEGLKTLARTEGGGYLDTLTDLRKALEDEPPDTARRLELESAIKSSDEAGAENLAAVTISLQRPYEGDVSAEYARGRLLELRDEYTNAGDLDNAAYIQMRIDAMDGPLKGQLETAGESLLLDLSKPPPLPPPPPESWVQTLAGLRLALAKEPAGSDSALELEGVINLANDAARQKFQDALHRVAGVQPDGDGSVMGKYLSILEGDYYKYLDEGDPEAAREILVRMSAMNLGDAGYFRGQLVEMRDDYLAAGKFDQAAEVKTHLDSLDSFIGQQIETVNAKLLGGDGGTPGARPPPLPPPADADAPYSKFNFGTDVAPGGRLDDLDAATYGKLGDAPDEDIYAEVFVHTKWGKDPKYNKGAVVDDGGSAAIRTSGALQPVDDSAGALRGGDLDIGLPQVDVEDAAGLRSGLDSPDVLEGPGYARIEDTPAALESRPPAPIPDARARIPDPDLDDAADARHAAPEIGPDGAGWGTGGDVENEYATVRDGTSWHNRPVMPENENYKPNIRNTLEVFADPPPAGSANGRYTLELSEDTYEGVESGTIVLKVYDEAGDELRPGSYVITKAPDAPPPPERTTQQILEDLLGNAVSVEEWTAQNVKGWLEANPGADGRTVEDLRPVLDGIPDDYSLPADTTHYATPRSLDDPPPLPPPMNDDTFRQGLLDGPDHIYSKVLGDRTGQGTPWNSRGTVGGPVGSPNFAGEGTVGPWTDLTGEDLSKWLDDLDQSLIESGLFETTTAEELMSHPRFDDFRKFQIGEERRTLEREGNLINVFSGLDKGDNFVRLDVAADAAEVENARVRQANADIQWLRDSAPGHIGGRSSQTDPWKPSWAGRYGNPVSEDVFGWTTTPETVSDAVRGADAFKADSKTTARAGDYLGQIDDVLRHGADDPVFEDSQWSKADDIPPPTHAGDIPPPQPPPDGPAEDAGKVNDLYQQFIDARNGADRDGVRDILQRAEVELDDLATGHFGRLLEEYGGYNGRGYLPKVEDLGDSADIRTEFVKMLDGYRSDPHTPSAITETMEAQLIKFDELANNKITLALDEAKRLEEPLPSHLDAEELAGALEAMRVDNERLDWKREMWGTTDHDEIRRLLPITAPTDANPKMRLSIEEDLREIENWKTALLAAEAELEEGRNPLSYLDEMIDSAKGRAGEDSKYTDQADAFTDVRNEVAEMLLDSEFFLGPPPPDDVPPRNAQADIPPTQVGDVPPPPPPPPPPPDEPSDDAGKFNDLYQQLVDARLATEQNGVRDSLRQTEIDLKEFAIDYFGPILEDYGGYGGPITEHGGGYFSITPKVDDLGDSANIREEFVKLLDSYQSDPVLTETMEAQLIKFDQYANREIEAALEHVQDLIHVVIDL